MDVQNVFKRYEIKYLITRGQYELLRNRMEAYMVGDEFGQSAICNIYFDTPTYLLIRRSLESPVYKEKLRLRSYGVAGPESTAFVEIKKKYDSVVYKRRMGMTERQAERYLKREAQGADTQIAHEIDYFLDRYDGLRPAVFLSYQRQAFYAKDDRQFRVTFDEDILWREYDLSLCAGIYGAPVLERDGVLMEIKTAGAIPLWMTALLSENHIYKTSFSKYGAVYQTMLSKLHRGGICCA